MAEANVATMKANISSAYEAYIAQLKASDAIWEKKPAGGAEGEDAWCAKQVAEHIAGANTFFGAGIAGIIGCEGPKPSQVTLANAGEAVTKTNETYQQLSAVMAQVKDEQLGMEIEHPQLGKQSVGSLLGIVSYHLTDHAAQLKTLAEA